MRKTLLAALVTAATLAPVLAQAASTYEMRFPLRGVASASSSEPPPAEGNSNAGDLHFTVRNVSFGTSLAPQYLTVKNGSAKYAHVDYSSDRLFDIEDALSTCATEENKGQRDWSTDPPTAVPGTGLAPGGSCTFAVFPESPHRYAPGTVVTETFELENKASGSTVVADTATLTMTVPTVTAVTFEPWTSDNNLSFSVDRHYLRPESGYNFWQPTGLFAMYSRANVPVPVQVEATGKFGVFLSFGSGDPVFVRGETQTIMLPAYPDNGNISASFVYMNENFNSDGIQAQPYSGYIKITANGQTHVYNYTVDVGDCGGGC